MLEQIAVSRVRWQNQQLNRASMPVVNEHVHVHEHARALSIHLAGGSLNVTP